MLVGDPVDLSDLAGRPDQRGGRAAAVQQATDRIMAAITGLVEQVRGEQAPPERFDMRRGGAQADEHHQDRKDTA